MTAVPITLSDAARARIAELTARKPGAAGVVLRIARGKGCGGNEYRMEYMDNPDANGFDVIAVGPDAALYIPMSDSLYMFGMSIDFKIDELKNASFIFINPNEAGRCGCGESFALDPSDFRDDEGACGSRS